MDLIGITRAEAPAVCTRACMCAQKRVSGGKKKKKKKMQGSSNVNYSGLGHLLCNSKMSQRCMLLHVLT